MDPRALRVEMVLMWGCRSTCRSGLGTRHRDANRLGFGLRLLAYLPPIVFIMVWNVIFITYTAYCCTI